MKIAKKISLLVIPLSIIPLIILGLFSYNSILSNYEDETFLGNEQLCLVPALKIESALDECYSGLNLITNLIDRNINELSNSKFLILLTNSIDAPIIETAQELAVRFSPHLKIAFITADGNQFMELEGMQISRKNKSLIEEPFFLNIVAASSINFSAFQTVIYTDNNTGNRFTIFAGPVYYSTELLGFVFLYLDVDIFSRVLADAKNKNPGSYILSDGMHDIFAISGDKTVINDVKNGTDIRDLIQKNTKNLGSGFNHFRNRIQNKEYFFSTRPVKEYIASRDALANEAWYLTVARSETPLESVFNSSKIMFAILVIISFIIAVSGTIYISRRITRPISYVNKAAGEIAKGNLDLKIKSETDDEVGQLAVSLNNMVAELNQLINERKTNEALISIGRFSAVLAHDLRNPVEGIKLLIRELLRRLEIEKPEYEIADTINQAVTKLSLLLNQSLDFSRLSKPVFTPVNLASVTEEVLNESDLKNIRLIKKIEPDLPDINADLHQLKRVLYNLLKNAIEACHQKSNDNNEISISIAQKGNHIVFQIQDTGVGIPEEMIEKIFDPFFTTKYKGHGLGLSLVKQIIENHNSTIVVTSEIDKGTCFVIKFPVV